MGTTAAPRPTTEGNLPGWLRAALAQALWCWLAVALAFGLSRALIAIGSDLAPLPFAAYSVLIFVLLPAVPAVIAIVVVSGAQRMAPPAWVQVLVVGLALGGWAFFANRSPGWALAYAAVGGLAAALALVARSRRSLWTRIGVLLLGAMATGALWYWVESLG